MPQAYILNDQVFIYTKAINELVLNEVEEVALGSLYQSVSHAMGLGAINAVAAQQQNYITAQAVTTMGATQVYE